MELDRPHLRSSSSSNNASNNNNNELFICFASRLSSSSSSMKLAKSILSPGRAACDAPVSLSNSLSRRLKSNGSMKGGQASPMFPSVGKKKGCNFENPEPSSPKVTCIGQVRVKTKKKASQTRSLSRRRSGGEVSFRKAGESHEFVSLNNEDRFSGRNSRHVQECLPERNQRWVHFPVTICEALRAVGAEFSCLFPCGSSCFSTKEKDEKSSTIRDEREDQESCGAVFARWFVSLQDCEGRQAKQIELVVGGDEDRTEVMERKSMRSSRRHVFEDIQFNQEKFELKVEEEGEQEEEKGRVSICVPPKNALLLMRCRSDPVQMAALTNRVWESPALTKDEEEDEEDPDEEISKKGVREDAFLREFSQFINETEPVVGHENEKSQDIILVEDEKGFESVEKDANLVEEMQDNYEEGKTDEQLQCNEESQQLQIEEQTLIEAILRSSSEAHVIQQVAEEVNQENGEEESCSPSRHSSSSRDLVELAEKIETGDEKPEPEEAFSEAAGFEELQGNENKTEDLSVEEKIQDPVDDEMLLTTRLDSQQDPEILYEDAENDRQECGIAERVIEKGKDFEENKEESFLETKKIDNESSTTSSSPAPAKVLPDCLLLMMCEPKLSMDMSKETWVCSTDFVRWLPERPVKKVNEESKKTIATEVLNLNTPQQPPAAAAAQDSKTRKKKQQQGMQPPRSSCTLPAAAAASMATMMEQKLVNAVGYEPCVLTRCKSEPMRTAAAKLVPDACCWKNRKLEPHRQAAFGVGAAGLGF